MDELSRSKAERRILNGLTQCVKTRQCAFTLVELLIVIAIIAILAAILMPVLNKAQQRAINIGAVNNVRQLVIGWKMYITDNSNYLPQNRDSNRHPTWCAGEMRGTQGGTAPSIGAPSSGEDYTNTALLMDNRFSQMGGFVQNPKVYLDPGDQGTWKDPGGPRQAHVRSFSMNCACGADVKDDGDPLGGGDNYWRYYLKDSDFIAPSPADVWVFLDEHPDSINDDYLDFSMPLGANLTAWIDMPAAYHNGACAFAFADGHAELHPWRYPGAFPLVDWDIEQTATPIRSQSINTGGNPDILWFAAHTTAPAATAPAGTYYP